MCILLSNIKDITGQRFGRLTVIEYAYTDKQGNARWLCKCDCGNETISIGKGLRCGDTKSCGCARIERAKTLSTKHGLCKTRLHTIWLHMRDRCLKPYSTSYERYGARGIKVCKEWLNDFVAFYNWAMSNGYKKNLTIDRIDNNGNYEPSNCRWATIEQQANNKRSSCWLEYKGERKTIAQWASSLNISEIAIRHRIDRGWTIERTLTEKIHTPEECKKAVVQIDINTGKHIKEYSSIADAARAVNTTPINISVCCRGKAKSASGYKWIFKNSNNTAIANGRHMARVYVLGGSE